MMQSGLEFLNLGEYYRNKFMNNVTTIHKPVVNEINMRLDQGRYIPKASINDNSKIGTVAKGALIGLAAGGLGGGIAGAFIAPPTLGVSIPVGIGIGMLIGMSTGSGIGALVGKIIENFQQNDSKVLEEKTANIARIHKISVEEKLSSNDKNQDLICPLTGKPIIDPVIHPYSPRIFERSSLEEAVKATGMCPLTNHPLTLNEIRRCPNVLGKITNNINNVRSNHELNLQERTYLDAYQAEVERKKKCLMISETVLNLEDLFNDVLSINDFSIQTQNLNSDLHGI